MIDRRTRLWLLDMREHAQRAIEFLDGRDPAAVLGEPIRLYALNRAVEIVGEAARRVNPAMHDSLSGIPWRAAIGLRNRLIHGYDRVDVDVVVKTVREDFPVLIAEIERILNDPGQA